MAKRRDEQKTPVKKRPSAQGANITPAKWFNLIVIAILVLVLGIVLFGLLRTWG